MPPRPSRPVMRYLPSFVLRGMSGSVIAFHLPVGAAGRRRGQSYLTPSGRQRLWTTDSSGSGGTVDRFAVLDQFHGRSEAGRRAEHQASGEKSESTAGEEPRSHHAGGFWFAPVTSRGYDVRNSQEPASLLLKG